MDRWLNHPTSLKIISVVLALLLWAVVHFDPESPSTVASLTENKEIEAIVRAEGLDESMYELRLIEPSAVKMTVRGGRSDLLSASQDDYKVTVDLTGVTEGKHVLPIKVTPPRRIQLIELSSDRVTVQLVPIRTSEFEAQMITTGTPAYDYKAGPPVVKPNSRVFVTLPEDLMDQVGIVGAQIDIEGEEDTVNRKRVKLIVYDKQGEEISEAVVDPAVVEVEVPITKPFKQLPLRIGTTGKLADGLSLVSIKPELEEVTVYGPQTELDKYEFFDNAVVNLSSIKQSGTFSIDLKPQQGVASVNPAKLNIQVEVAASEMRTLPQLPITVIGLSEGLNYEFAAPEDGRMDIQVKGAPSILAELVAKDIRLIADVNGRPPGTHTVPIEVQLPRYIELATKVQQSAKITVIDSDEATAEMPDGSPEEPVEDNTGEGSEPPAPGDVSNPVKPGNIIGSGNTGNEEADSGTPAGGSPGLKEGNSNPKVKAGTNEAG